MSPSQCPIMYKRESISHSNNTRKKFDRLLDYALTISRQEEIGNALGVSQGEVSKYSTFRRFPRHCNLQDAVDRLTSLIKRKRGSR